MNSIETRSELLQAQTALDRALRAVRPIPSARDLEQLRNYVAQVKLHCETVLGMDSETMHAILRAQGGLR